MRLAAIQLSALACSVALPAAAHATRPTEGGLHSFDPTDVVEHWDEPTGAVRVHYSVEGPNVTLLADADTDGVPDFVQDVATTAAQVLSFYEQDVGLRPPLSEEDMSLDALGGSYALDVYLVNFAGAGDGAFGIDACDASNHCSGYLSIENDFYGYGYPSLQLAIDVLTSHELFHGVQQAYDSRQEIWFTEGTAVWAERQYDPGSRDFMSFASAYLEDTGRSLNRPPTGPVPSFAYGTCLWWDFLTTRLGVPFLEDLLLAIEPSGGTDDDTLTAMESVIVAAGDTLEDAWLDFAAWNLATGPRAGVAASYTYATSLGGISAEAQGPVIDDDNRFYPLAVTYYRLDHGGGRIWFGIQDAAPDLRFGLHPVQFGIADGDVGEAAAIWTGDKAGARALAGGQEFREGGYWIWGTLPALAEQSTKVRICVGDRTAATACGPVIEDDPEDPEDPEDPDGGGCTAASTSTNSALPFFLSVLLVALGTRRRRS